MKINNHLLKREIALAIKKNRTKEGKSQVQLAKDSGIGRTTIVNLENREQGLSLEVLYKICSALSIEVSDILPKVNKVVIASNKDAQSMTNKPAIVIEGKNLSQELGVELAEEVTEKISGSDVNG